MRKILFITTIFFTIAFPQSENMQYSDTIRIQIDKSNLAIIKSNWGWGFSFGINQFTYGSKTEQWLGNHGGPNFQGVLSYKQWFLQLGFRPWTINPHSKLNFGSDTLDEFADLNPIKTEIAIGYKFYVYPDIILMPYLGYVNSSFSVINEDELKKKFDISSASGLTLGSYVNFVFLRSVLEEYSIRFGYSTSFVDFKKVHPNLDKNYWVWEIGIIASGIFYSVKEIPN